MRIMQKEHNMQAHHASTAATTTSPSQAGETVLRTHDLTKQYGSCVGVNQLNLEIRRGENVRFFRAQGAGENNSVPMLPWLLAATSRPGGMVRHDPFNTRGAPPPRHFG